MTKTESGLGAKADSVIRRRKKVYFLTVGFIACVGIAGAVLSAMGIPVYGEDAPEWRRILFMVLIFLPMVNLFVSNMFYSSELTDAVAVPYSGPQQSGFTVRVPSRLEQKSTSYVIIPFATLGSSILLVTFLGPVIGDAVIASGASFGVFGAVLASGLALVLGVGVWTGHRFSVNAKRQKSFRDEFHAALEGAGFSWAKRDLEPVPVDYVDGNSVSLSDSSGLVSKWTMTWDGEVATLTPVPAEA